MASSPISRASCDVAAVVKCSLVRPATLVNPPCSNSPHCWQYYHHHHHPRISWWHKSQTKLQDHYNYHITVQLQRWWPGQLPTDDARCREASDWKHTLYLSTPSKSDADPAVSRQPCRYPQKYSSGVILSQGRRGTHRTKLLIAVHCHRTSGNESTWKHIASACVQQSLSARSEVFMTGVCVRNRSVRACVCAKRFGVTVQDLTRSSAIAKITALPSCLVSVFHDISWERICWWLINHF